MIDSMRQRPLWPRGEAREAAFFSLVVAIVIDGLLVITRVGPVGSGALFGGWSLIKHAVIVAGLAWLWSQIREPALLALAALVAVVGVEEVVELTAELGKVVAELIGVGTGELGVNSQFLGRLLVAGVAGGPAVYLALRSQEWLRMALYSVIGLLGLLFVLAVGVDALSDIRQGNLDEALEEPVVSALAALTVGLVVEYRRRRRVVRGFRPTRTAARRRGSRLR